MGSRLGGLDQGRPAPGRRARPLAVAGLGLSAVAVAAIAVTVAIVVGCRDQNPGGCMDPRRPETVIYMPHGLFYAQAPAEYAALLHAEMDLLVAAPTAYATLKQTIADLVRMSPATYHHFYSYGGY